MCVCVCVCEILTVKYSIYVINGDLIKCTENECICCIYTIVFFFFFFFVESL